MAVVGVPVEDGDPGRAVDPLGVAGGDRGMVEDAESVRVVGAGVVPRRAHGAEHRRQGIGGGEEPVGGGQRAARCQRGGLVRAAWNSHGRLCLRPRRCPRDRRDERRRVGEREVFDRGRPGDADERRGERGGEQRLRDGVGPVGERERGIGDETDPSISPDHVVAGGNATRAPLTHQYPIAAPSARGSAPPRRRPCPWSRRIICAWPKWVSHSAVGTAT